MNKDREVVSVWQRSPLIRAGRWFCSKRGIRRVLLVVAWTVTLIGVFYAEENFRGRHAWNRYSKELVARGEQLDWKAFIPPPIPDSQNFAANPFVQSWFDDATNTETRWRDNYSLLSGKMPSQPAGRSKSDPNRSLRDFMDLVGWEMAFAALKTGSLQQTQRFESSQLDSESRAKAAPAVLAGLQDSENNLAQLRLASARPACRYPINYEIGNPWAVRVPHYSNLRAAGERLQLAACAELAAGHRDTAFENVKLMLYLADSLKSDPFIVSHLVRLGLLRLSIQPVWEGLAEHRWSEPQLQSLQKRLQQLELIPALRRPLGIEQAAGVWTVNFVRRTGKFSSFLDPAPYDSLSPYRFLLGPILPWMVPSGWYYREQLNYCRLYQKYIQAAFDERLTQVRPAKSEAFLQETWPRISRPGLSHILHHYVTAALLLPDLNGVSRKTARAQTEVNQALLACALERYRLAEGKFPETLDALAPQWIAELPRDVITGQPYHYRLEQNAFVLYSVGWDEKDDGGAASKKLFDDKQGDWAWRYRSQ